VPLLSELAPTEPEVDVYDEGELKLEFFATCTVQDVLPVPDQLSVAEDPVTLAAWRLVGCDCARTITPRTTCRTNIFAANFMKSD
jgi:hypothetical protein